MWTTWATDGKALGNMNFLDNYWLYSRSKPEYTELEAKVIQVKESPDDDSFETYDVKSALGVASFNLRKELRPTVHMVLGVPEKESLENKTVRAYYEGRSLLVGITCSPKKGDKKGRTVEWVGVRIKRKG